jgi:hypothetical protein
VGAVVDVADPLVAGGQRQHEAGAEGHDPQLGALVAHPLAEEENADERHERDERRQPGVLEEPARPLGDDGLGPVGPTLGDTDQRGKFHHRRPLIPS